MSAPKPPADTSWTEVQIRPKEPLQGAAQKAAIWVLVGVTAVVGLAVGAGAVAVAWRVVRWGFGL